MKKIILLALAAASVAALLALPAAAMAEDVPLHVIPAPSGSKTIDGVGHATLTASFGKITCESSSGTATFENSTTGSFEQTFHGCTEPFGGKCTTAGQPEGTITTTTLPFHLLTVEDTVTKATGPGVLVTPAVGTKHFATFKCPLVGERKVEGNGLIGTITLPECGKESTEATISFSSSSQGVQTHKTVVGTTEEYTLENASEDAEGTITLGTKAKLECT